MSLLRTLLVFLLCWANGILLFLANGILLFWANASVAVSIFDHGERHFELPGDHRDISGGIVSAIAQDSTGFIWIGGQQGAMRYDGYQFKLYKHDPEDPFSIAGNYIQALWIAPDGQVWFGTYGDGLSVLDPKTDKFHNILLATDTTDLSRNAIQGIVGESSERIWIASNGGISYINPTTQQITHITSIKGCDPVYQQRNIKTLLFNEFDGLWIGGENGLCRASLPAPGDGQTTLIGKSYPQLRGYGINELLFSNSEHLWLGTLQNGVARLNIDNSELQWLHGDDTELEHSWVVSMIKADDRHIWVGTLDDGIMVVDIEQFHIRQRIQHDEGLSGTISLDNMGALYKDKTGLIWVGTWGAGLNMFDPSADSIRSIRHSHNKDTTIKSARIRAVAETHNGDIWLGYNQEGISIISLQSGAIRHIEPQPEIPGALSNGDILALQHTQNGEVWIGTRNGGLQRYDADTGLFVSYSHLIEEGLKTVTGFTIENEERLWIATTRGMWYASLASKEVFDTKDFVNNEGLAQKVVYSSTWQQPDSIWAGTDEGLYHIATSTKQVQFLHPQQENTVALSDNAINTVMVDHNNQLWVGTEGGLDKLASWDGELAKFTSVYEQLGVDGEYTENMQTDNKGRIWYYRGVIDLANNTLDHLDNLDAWSIGTIWLGSDLKTSDNKILFGGNDGLLLINPERYQPALTDPHMALTRVQLNNQGHQHIPGETLTLPANNQSMSIEFSALDFARAAKIQYAWMLKGFDTEWNEGDVAVRRATYTNLPKGSYEFLVKHRIADQQWFAEKALLNITVLPAWYETTIARLGFILVLLIFMWLVFSIRTRQLVLQKQKLDAQILKQTKELRQANLDKDRIMSILAHDINNKITINMGYLDLLRLSINKASGDELKNYIDKALDNGQDCSELVAELRDYGKLSSESNDIPLERTNIVTATKKIIELHLPAALKKSIRIEFNTDSNKLYCRLDQSKFSRILENLLSNAIKFSESDQVVEVSLKQTSDSVLLSVADEGIGIPQDIQDNLFSDFINSGRPGTQGEKSSGLGLYIVKKLVVQHQGCLRFRSEEDKGTTFYVEFPVS